MVIGDEVGHVPGQEAQGLSSQVLRRMDSGSGFHDDQFFVLSTGSLQERSAILQDDRRFIAETVLRDRQSRPTGLA
jgi:hypothetical protein